MKKFLILFLLLVPLRAFGQTTSVTLTVVDSSGGAWNNGVYVATLTPPPGQPPSQFFLNGVLMTSNQLTVTGNLNAAGVATFNLSSNTSITPSNSSWGFQVCFNQPSNPCYFSSPTTITGGSQAVNLTPPPAQGAPEVIKRIAAPIFSATDTLNDAVSTEQFYASSMRIPANTIAANVVLQFFIGLEWTTSAAATNGTLRIYIGPTNGSATGAKAIYTSTQSSPATSLTLNSGMVFTIQGTQAPGASTTMWFSNSGGTGASFPIGRSTTSATQGSLATNADLFVFASITWAAGGSGANSLSVRQLIAGPGPLF